MCSSDLAAARGIRRRSSPFTTIPQPEDVVGTRADHPLKTMTLDAQKFIRRFLLHVLPVLPDGFQRIRYYGFLGNRYREEKLALCRQLLGMAVCQPPVLEAGKDYRDRARAQLRLLPISVDIAPADIAPEDAGLGRTNPPTAVTAILPGLAASGPNPGFADGRRVH